MNIGIDIDDTIVDTITPILKYANIYNQKLGLNVKCENEVGLATTAHYLEDTYGWDEKTALRFFDEYYKQVLEECKIRRNAASVLQKLKSEGHTISFITARFPIEPHCDSEKITKQTLAKYNIPYDNLVMNVQKKAEDCKKLNIDIFIDDSYEQCKLLEKNGIKAFLITTKMNNKLKENDIERASSWNDLYSKINNLKNQK